MLAADKLQLQSALKQQATALKEKEFNLHHSNFMTVGTQAAVLAGLDITMFIEFNPPSETTWQEEHRWLCRSLRAVYYATIIAAFCANMIVVSQTTALSVLGAGLALRGPDGSMMTATEGLYEERRSVFKTFAAGLSLTVGSLLVCVWLLLPCEAAFVCWCVALYTSRRIYVNYHRVAHRFDFDESDTVDFTDIFNGPAAIRAMPAAVHHVLSHVTTATVGAASPIKKRSSKNQKKTDAPVVEAPTSSFRPSFFFRGGSSSSSTLASSTSATNGTATSRTRNNNTNNNTKQSTLQQEEDEDDDDNDDDDDEDEDDLEQPQSTSSRLIQQQQQQQTSNAATTALQRKASASSVKQRRAGHG
ncbi:hypothetical protein ACA910_004496 [Epithemia clementina (nom. ined.)]